MRVQPGTPTGLGAFLLESGFLDAAAFVDGDLRFVQESRRNDIVRVLSSTGPSYFVKQAGSLDGASYIAREAAFYTAAASDERLAGIRRYLPARYAYDSASQVLVLELLTDYENLREYHRRRGRFQASTARRLGSALGALYRATSTTFRERKPGSSAADPPWILSLHRPPLAVLDTLSGASIEFIKVVQRFPEFGAHLDELRLEWTPSALVHFDLGWENCLVGPDGVKFVDWEFCGYGDPLWDAGSLIAGYLSVWVESMPADSSVPAEDLPALARYPLAKMQPALRAFWDAYVAAAAIAADDQREASCKALGYCAARLLELAYGRLQGAQSLSSHALVLAQLSLNLLKRPLEARESVLGLTPAARSR